MTYDKNSFLSGLAVGRQLKGWAGGGGGGGARIFTGTYDLTNVTAGDTPATFADGDGFSTVLTADSGYMLPGMIDMTMAGVALTQGTHFSYAQSTGQAALLIPVRGDLTLTAAGVQIVTLYGPNRAYPHYAILVTRSYLEAPTYHVVWLASASATPDYSSWHVTVGGNYYAAATGIRASSGFYKSAGCASLSAALDAVKSAVTAYTYNAAGAMNRLVQRFGSYFGEQVEYSSLTLYECVGNANSSAVTTKAASPIANSQIVYLA